MDKRGVFRPVALSYQRSNASIPTPTLWDIEPFGAVSPYEYSNFLSLILSKELMTVSSRKPIVHTYLCLNLICVTFDNLKDCKVRRLAKHIRVYWVLSC